MKKIFIILSILLTILSYIIDINRNYQQEQAKLEEEKRIESIINETYDKRYAGYVEALQLIAKMDYRDWRSINSTDILHANNLIDMYKYGERNNTWLYSDYWDIYKKKLDEDVYIIDVYSHALEEICRNQGKLSLEDIIKNDSYTEIPRHPYAVISRKEFKHEIMKMKYLKHLEPLKRDDELGVNINSFIGEVNSILDKE